MMEILTTIMFQLFVMILIGVNSLCYILINVLRINSNILVVAHHITE